MKHIIYALRCCRRYDGTVIPFAILLALLNIAAPVAGIFLPKLTLDLLSDGAASTQIAMRVGTYTLMLAVLHFFLEFVRHQRNWRTNHIAQGSTRDLFYHNLECEYSYLENPERQALYARLRRNEESSGNNSVNKTLTALIGIVSGTLGFILYALILSGLNIWIVLFLTITSLVSFFVLRYARNYEHKNKHRWALLDKKIAYIIGVTGNYEYGKDIRLYNMIPWLGGIARSLLSSRSAWDKKLNNRRFLSAFSAALTVLLRDGAAYALLIWRVTQGSVSVADFMLFFGAIAGFSGIVTDIVDHIGVLSGALLYIADIRDYLAGGTAPEPEVPAPPFDLQNPPVIEFDNVSFGYTPDTRVLDKLNFTIRAGEKVAVVGVNGAGKTTMVKLLCGFYTPTEGQIRINGVDTRHCRRADLYKLLSIVFQDEFILPFTVSENLSAAVEGNEAGMRRALESAGLWGYIEGLPKGLRSPMTKVAYEDGVMLSGGQKQKLFLARALYKDAPVLILDEPTAALDPVAESEVYEAYHKLTEGKTSVFISHRLASTRFCDNILLLGNGAVLEAGTHEELMALGGEYANMYEIQSHYYREEAVSDATA